MPFVGNKKPNASANDRNHMRQRLSPFFVHGKTKKNTPARTTAIICASVFSPFFDLFSSVICGCLLAKKGKPSRSRMVLEAGVAAEQTQEGVTPPLQAPVSTQDACPHQEIARRPASRQNKGSYWSAFGPRIPVSLSVLCLCPFI